MAANYAQLKNMTANNAQIKNMTANNAQLKTNIPTPPSTAQLRQTH